MTPQPKHLWAAVVRGHAIQCSHQQEDVDIIIPVVLNPDAKLSLNNLSFIAIQVKNRVRSSTSVAFPIASNIGLDEGKSTPYVSILLQLGVDQPQGEEHKITLPNSANYYTFTVHIPAAPLHGMTLRPKATESNQYCIRIDGCSHESIGVIRKDENKLFQEMLDSQDILASHPRGHDCCVEAVAALKPIWAEKRGIYDWANFSTSS